MDYCTFHSVRDIPLQKGGRQLSSQFYKDNWLQEYKLKMKCNRQQQKVSHHANIMTARESLAIRKKKTPPLLSYGQANLPSHTSVTLYVITHFLTKLHSSQNPDFVKR